MSRTRRRCLLGTTVLALALLLAAVWSLWPARLFYNPSSSAPRGWYLQSRAHVLRTGQAVLVRLPTPVARLADVRGYLPQPLPLLKRVGALGGQRVCVHDGVVRIDGRAVAVLRTHDGRGRPLPAWRRCRMLARGEVFLLSVGQPASFDSRYFGPVPRESVLGEAMALWTW